jgi:hypothetical protein
MGVGVVCHVFALRVYDSILRAQYELARTVWAQRGSEIGYNCAPPGTSLAWRFLRMPGRQAKEWLLATPDWTKSYPAVARRMRLFRVLEAVFVAALALLLVIVSIRASLNGLQ